MPNLPGPYDRRVRSYECLAQYIDRALCGQVKHSWSYGDFKVFFVDATVGSQLSEHHYLRAYKADISNIFDLAKIPPCPGCNNA
jgi:hypothetical protein